jgi:hypothetical protein
VNVNVAGAEVGAACGAQAVKSMTSNVESKVLRNIFSPFVVSLLRGVRPQ